jgi:hypothetical protein
MRLILARNLNNVLCDVEGSCSAQYFLSDVTLTQRSLQQLFVAHFFFFVGNMQGM